MPISWAQLCVTLDVHQRTSPQLVACFCSLGQHILHVLQPVGATLRPYASASCRSCLDLQCKLSLPYLWRKCDWVWSWRIANPSPFGVRSGEGASSLTRAVWPMPSVRGCPASLQGQSHFLAPMDLCTATCVLWRLSFFSFSRNVLDSRPP